jgi:hypothetical protein
VGSAARSPACAAMTREKGANLATPHREHLISMVPTTAWSSDRFLGRIAMRIYAISFRLRAAEEE